VDGTVGGGGHAAAILEASGPDGRLVGLDVDDEALSAAAGRLRVYGERVVLVRANFAHLDRILQRLDIERVDGILLDLGVSSHQLGAPQRGFSFSAAGPLDMRMDRRLEVTAADIVNTYSEEELETIIRQWGEERKAARVARAIVAHRRRSPIGTTSDLARIVASAVGGRRGGGIHPATRTFQALRIAVNDELANLKRALETGVDLLSAGGRFSVVSFHSLEDRMVKETFRRLADPCSCPADLPVCVCGRAGKVRLVTGRPVRPGEEEVRSNPRAASARLRTVERI